VNQVFADHNCVIVTTQLGDKLKQTIRITDAILDERQAGNYYCIVGEDHQLWGENITPFGEAD
jgi:hypothetical protein